MSFLLFGKPTVSISQNPMSQTGTNEKQHDSNNQPSLVGEHTPVGIHTLTGVPILEDFTPLDHPNTDGKNLASMLAATAREISKPDVPNDTLIDDIYKLGRFSVPLKVVIDQLQSNLKAAAKLGKWDYIYPNSPYTSPDEKQTLDKSVIEHFKKEGLVVSTNCCTCNGAKYICNCPSGVKFSWLHLKSSPLHLTP